MPLHVQFAKKAYLPATFRAHAERALETLPSYAKTALDENDFRIVIGNKLPDLHPGLRERGASSGFFAPAIKVIFLARSREINNQAYKKRSPKNALFHEVGHFLDLFVAGTGQYPQGYRSDGDHFSSAFRKDIEGIHEKGFTKLFTLHYPQSKGQDYFKTRFMERKTARHEVYAELWAQLNGCLRIYPLRPFFPECAKIVKEDIAAFRRQEKKNNSSRIKLPA